MLVLVVNTKTWIKCLHLILLGVLRIFQHWLTGCYIIFRASRCEDSMCSILCKCRSCCHPPSCCYLLGFSNIPSIWYFMKRYHSDHEKRAVIVRGRVAMAMLYQGNHLRHWILRVAFPSFTSSLRIPTAPISSAFPMRPSIQYSKSKISLYDAITENDYLLL